MPKKISIIIATIVMLILILIFSFIIGIVVSKQIRTNSISNKNIINNNVEKK